MKKQSDSVSHKLSNNKAVVSKLLKINRLATELQEETTPTAIGKLLDVSRQTIHYHMREEKA